MAASETLHASAVAFGPSGLLIIGKSGSGKSTLALQLIGLGASLIADDGVLATPKDDGLWLSAPPPLDGKIEARGVGLLICPSTPAWARAVVTLDETETDRLPEPKTTRIAGISLPLLSKVESPAFPAILKLYLREHLNTHD